MCARRKKGQLRLAMDYRALNAQTISNSVHPIPLIEDLLDRLGNARIFSTLDLKSGYHQMPMREKGKELTEFVVLWGQYSTNGKGVAHLDCQGLPQHSMSVILGDSQYKEALCYLDDILVWGRDLEEHINRLRSVLEKIRLAGVVLSPSKCVFGAKRVEYLGYVIEAGKLKIREDRVEQIRKLRRPETLIELRRALEAFAYVQRWIPGMADIAKPLYEVLEKNGRQKLIWTTEMDEAFNELKKRAANSIALNVPDFCKKFVLVTDASNEAVGAMLANREDGRPGGQLKPIAFFHHTLTSAERHYGTTEKELLAVVLAIRKFRVYLGKPFDLITDHKALLWLRTLDMTDERGRRGRWLEILQQYEFSPIHKAGRSKEMAMADYLSRVGVDGHLIAVLQQKSEQVNEGKWMTELLDLDTIRQEQYKDCEL